MAFHASRELRRRAASSKLVMMTRRRVTTMAAVAAFVLVIAAVAVVASRGGGGPEALPKLAYGAGDSSATTAVPANALADGRATLAPYGGVTYEVRGSLAELGGTAPAFTVEPDATKARIDRLAAALGVPADHVAVDPMGNDVVPGGRLLVITRGSWALTSGSPGCSVSSDGTTSCVSSGVAAVGNGSSAAASGEPAIPPDGPGSSAAGPVCPMPPCPPGAACAQVCPQPAPGTGTGTGSGSGPGQPFPATTIPGDPPPARPADLPSRADAERIGRAVAEKAGVDTAGAAVRVDDLFSAWSVTVTPQVAGLPTTGLETTITVGPKGALLGGYGRLVKLTKVGDYPLAGSAKGLERLKAGSFAGPVPLVAPGWSPAPAPAAGGSDTGGASTVVEAQPAQPADAVPPAPPVSPPVLPPTTGTLPLPAPTPPTPTPPVAPVAPQPIVVTVTGVHLGLTATLSSGGRETLAPVYVFETATEGQLIPVPAVTDALLEPAEVPLTKGGPEPVPDRAPNPPAPAGVPGVAPPPSAVTTRP